MAEDEEVLDEAGRRRKMQEIKRQVVRKIEGVTDPFLLDAILEMIVDAEVDMMDGEKDPEIVEASLNERDHPGNRTRPAPVNMPNKGEADSWLDGLGR